MLILFFAVLLAGPFTAGAGSPGIAAQLSESIADTVEKVMPSVVVIRTESVVYHAARDVYFGRVYGIPEKLAGQGSGVIISKEGHVLTSHHVIEKAQQIEVVLSDGTKYPAELVGRDPPTDLAVVKIKAEGKKDFTPIEAGDSEALRVGELVIALGSPFSLGGSVTAGIVSQKGRAIGAFPYEDFIQTDASINPGNSGGPLVDAEGRMVGLCAVIQTGSPYSRGSIGIGFAVPVNLAMRIADSLIRTGSAERPWVGIQLREMGEEDGDGPGVLVGEVYANTPAGKCGLMAGDIILTVDDKPVRESRDVQRIVFMHRVGDSVKVGVSRNGQPRVFEMITERMPDLHPDGP